MAKRVCNAVFLGGVLLALLLGLGRTVFRPSDVDAYENRRANKLAPFSLSAFLDGSWQEQAELALADQLPLSAEGKKLFNRGSSTVLWTALAPFLSDSSPRYVSFPPYEISGASDVTYRTALYGTEHLTYYTFDGDRMTDTLHARAANYNEAFARCPGVEFYVYYIQRDTDVNFETGEKTQAWERLRAELALPSSHLAALEIDSFAEYARCFYRTDHHWNPDGALRGYREAAALLGVDEPLLEPAERAALGEFSGSKGAGSGVSLFREPFWVYRYNFPAMSVTVNGAPAADYGSQSWYLDGGAGPLSYGAFYGGDDGEVVLDTGRPGREDILILGESYDNALLKLLASHFGRTCAVDLRYYEAYMGEKFRLSEYLEERGIKKVLLIGSSAFFLSQDFLLEG